MINLSQTTLYSLFCALLPSLLYMRIRQRKGLVQHPVWITLFILYCWQVYELTGVGGMSDFIYRPQGNLDNSLFQGNLGLIPFQYVTTSFWLNIVMCLPLGFLLPFIWKAYRKVHVTVLTGAAFSLFIELSQLVTTRATDIDDLIANTAGTLIGFIFWWLATKIFGEHLKAKGSIDGKGEAVAYMMISFAGLFFLYYPFWFLEHVLPFIFG